jgi:hypothetical protein
MNLIVNSQYRYNDRQFKIISTDSINTTLQYRDGFEMELPTELVTDLITAAVVTPVLSVVK